MMFFSAYTVERFIITTYIALILIVSLVKGRSYDATNLSADADENFEKKMQLS